MKPFRSIFGAGSDSSSSDSPLADLPFIFKNGTSRESELNREISSPAKRSGEFAQGWDADSWQVINQLFGGGRYAGTYGPKESYAMSPWMAPAIHAFAGTVAARTFRIMDRKKQIEDHWLLDLIARPNKFLRMSEFALLYFTAALWRYDGEVFWHLEYGDDQKKPGERRSVKQRPTAIWVWNKNAVQPKYDETKRPKEFLGWTVTYEGLEMFVDRLDMLHLPLFDPTQFNARGPSRGTSLWQAKRLAMTNEIRAQRWNGQWWDRGIAPSVAFIGKSGANVGYDPVSEQQFLDKLKAKLSGKNGEPMLLLGDWMVQQLEASQRDAQFVEGMDQNRKAILAGNTPPIAMGDNEANYANANAQIKAWLSFDVIPAMSFFASNIDTTFLYDEPRLWTEFSVDDIDELQEGRKERVERYVSLINTRHSPKVAAQIAGLDVDPSMPGYEDVLVPFSQVPYDFIADGGKVAEDPAPATAGSEPDPKAATAGNVEAAASGTQLNGAQVTAATSIVLSVASGELPRDSGLSQLMVFFKLSPDEAEKIMGAAGTSTPTTPNPKPEEASTAAPATEPQRFIRVRVPGSNVVTRAFDDGEILRILLKIVEKDAKKLKDRARQFQVQAFEAGTEQVGKTLELKTLLTIDNPRVVDFLEERGNLIQSVPEGVANRIFSKTVALVEKGTTPEDIGTILRKDFNVLTDAKARQIGRQEVGSALNGGRFLQMEEEGVLAREWLSSRDAKVRDSHVKVDGEVVERGEKYSNGLRYPQDPNGPNEEVQGCRCIELPAENGGKRSVRCAAHMRAMAALELKAAADRGEKIDERTAYWRSVVQAKNVRLIERRMTDAMSSVIHGWRAPILKALADMGVAK